MDVQPRDDSQISGKYKHFKGNYYDLYCVAFDYNGEKYILYRQCYGDESFWLRPYNMFFEKIQQEDGTSIDRFTKTSGKKQKVVNRIKALISMIENQTIIIHNSEDEEEYIITSINESQIYVTVHPVNNNCSGFLTDFELIKRIGYTACVVNGQTKFFKNRHKIAERKKLSIGDDDISVLSDQINPCSIDLQIADSGYICTKRRLVDPQSIETVSSAENLWKPVRVYKSKYGSRDYIKLRPGRTILTRTKEKLKIPLDCAAKIEIKSTFARLSLDITSGDFCNPGYVGHYPLEITNNGKHTIILHQSETMAQLMLIPLCGPILENYSEKATFKNKDGIDDGTPYSFWRERAIKTFRKSEGTQTIINVYNTVLNTITSENTGDINAFRERFVDGFLPFCQKRYQKEKYVNINSKKPDVKKLLGAYCKKEKFLKTVSSFKWFTTILSIFGILFSVLQLLSPTQQQILGLVSRIIHRNVNAIALLWISIALTLLLTIGFIALFLMSQKYYCTFEMINIEELCDQVEQ